MSGFLNFNIPDFHFDLNSIIFIVFFILIIIVLILSLIINLYQIFFNDKEHKKNHEDPLVKKIMKQKPGITHDQAHAASEIIREQAED